MKNATLTQRRAFASTEDRSPRPARGRPRRHIFSRAAFAGTPHRHGAALAKRRRARYNIICKFDRLTARWHVNILSLEKITKSYIDAPVLDGVSLYVGEGDRIGVIGANGAGKSTLMRIAAGVLKPDAGNVVVSSGARVSYLAQSPEFPEHMTVMEAVFHQLPAHGDEQEYEARAMLTRLGITDTQADVTTLSGGQRKRVAIAAALIRPCDLLLLDEPTNHIDAEMIAYLETQLARRSGALMMVTHDRYFLERVCNRIVEVEAGAVHEYEANYSRYLELKAEREQMAEASRRKLQALYRNELKWIRRGAAARTTKQRFRVERFDELSQQAAEQSAARQMEITTGHARLGKKLIELEGICKSYAGKALISDFSYSLMRDDRIGIIGPNGCGKSTLLGLISGELAPDSGRIVRGETVRIGFLHQEVPVYPPDKRVIDAVRDIANAIPTRDGVLTASQLCEQFLINSTMQYTPASRLSGGEKRRLYLMQVLMSAPNVLLLDEPTNDIDIQTLTILEDYLATFPGPVIAVSHDRYFLDKFARRVFAFTESGIVDSVGGYTDYRELADAQAKAAQAEAAATASRTGAQPSEQSPAERPRTGRHKLRFTFREQREFDTIEDDIAALEAQSAQLQSQMDAAASDYVKLGELDARKSEVDAQLAAKLDRWLELSELNERIQRGEYAD